jgi:hypothetical protein
LVAKSYQGLEVLCEPYNLNNRSYVRVRAKNGESKQVRWYTEAEYSKMYPEEKKSAEPSPYGGRKVALGFRDGYITIFKGNTYENLEWFKFSEARYARFWGWYFTSEMEVPADLPYGITPIKLTWEEVSKDGELYSEEKIRAYVDTLVYDLQPGEYVGKIGERLSLTLTVSNTYELENGYGSSTMHVMKDDNDNVFVWTTSAKNLAVGETYSLKGTVKNHQMYKGTKQTILTRCIVK